MCAPYGRAVARPVRTLPEAEAALRALPGGARALDAVAATPDAWVVGGAVRDALLGRTPLELDVVLGSDPEAFAAGLGCVLDGNERFGTGSFRLPEGLTVDLVRARRESYPVPGALPVVEPADLAADLARRDVSVNAIALRPGGELRSVPDALRDLEAGQLRVLHPDSFLDDPTRLWRVARYGVRLGFAVEPATAALAAGADPRTASGPRHGNELRRTLHERDAVGALRATVALAPALFPRGFDARPVHDALALLPAGEGRPELLVLARACAGVDAGELVDWLEGLGLTASERDVAAAGSRAAVLAPLRSARDGAAIGRAARGVPVELVALGGGENARRWIDELRHLRLAITGADLLAAGVAPGPEVGARLARARDAQLNGDAPDRARQLAVALG